MIYKEHTKKELNRLFGLLKKTTKEQKIKEIEDSIWSIWIHIDDEQIDLLMDKGCKALQAKQYNQAITLFSQIIELRPEYAEGWNKRATAYFKRGSYKASLDDIKQTLLREPRHFGALSGAVSIYMAIADFKGALQTFQQLAQIYPQREDVFQNIQKLKKKLGAT